MSTLGAALPIRIRGIEKKYGPVTILQRLDLDVAAGEFLTLLGPSGSGKTTLLMILAGFVRPDAGSIKIGGDEIIAAPPHRRNIGMVFQNYALFPHMSVSQNIAFPLRQRRVPAADIVRRVTSALEMVRLNGYGERRINQLSGGQRQRVALARAMVFEPRIVLMDEPLSALDKGLREHMQLELRDLHRSLGMTTIYVTHDQREAITMSDRIAVMNGGAIEQIDRPEALYAHPRTHFVASFIGESSFIPVDIRDGVPWFRDAKLQTTARTSSSGRYLMSVRPEKVRLAAAGGDDGINILAGVMGDVIYQGDSFACSIDIGDGVKLTMRDYCREDTMARLPARGESIRVSIAASDAILVEAG
ncbi:MAG: ABC transporter ATP-binding protein [Rhizobiales bacterium 65-9]|nr:ABC transporter ATP-binding protein [Hyphomicrobiales bacterium]OJY39440.1 MAG: ABC transporter ATP-binding protein [Rhizobiales bacterium 65-9]